MKLIRVGDTFEIVRTRPSQAGTTPFPDGLNRTQLRISDDLKEALGIENPEVQGVSKDIQLVSVIDQGIESETYEGEIIADAVEVENDLGSIIKDDNPYVVFNHFEFDIINNTGATQALQFAIQMEDASRVNGEAFIGVNTSVGAGAEANFVLQPNGRERAILYELDFNYSEPTRTVFDSVNIFDKRMYIDRGYDLLFLVGDVDCTTICRYSISTYKNWQDIVLK